MSLKSSGVSITLFSALGKVVCSEKQGYGFDAQDPAVAMRAAVEEYIASEAFKNLTTTSCHQSAMLRVEFLLHTSMP